MENPMTDNNNKVKSLDTFYGSGIDDSTIHMLNREYKKEVLMK